MNRRSVLAVACAWQARCLSIRSPSRPPSPPAAGERPLTSFLRWRSIGPDRGGRSIAVSGVKGRPREAYFGAVGGGLWKTIDGGDNWMPVTDGQIRSSSVGAVAVSESNPDIVFIGMGESCIRGNIMPGDGVYKSTDAGKTWTHVGFSDSQAISRIRIHPTNPECRLRRLVRQVRRAERRTRRLQERRRRQDVEENAVPRQQDRRRRHLDRPPQPERASSPRCGRPIASSTRCRAAVPAAACSSPPTAVRPGRRSHATAVCRPVSSAASASRFGADSNRIYALVENEKGGLFASDDAGTSWKLVNDNRNFRQRAFYYTHVAADPVAKDTVYLLNVSGYRSTDGGKTLTNVGQGTHGDHHDLWIDPDDPKHLVIGNDGGGAVSMQAGQAPSQGSGRHGRRRTFRPRSTTTSSRRSTCRFTSAARSRTAARSASAATACRLSVCRSPRRRQPPRGEQGGRGARSGRAAAVAVARRRCAGDVRRRRIRERHDRSGPERHRRHLRRRQQRDISHVASIERPESSAKSVPYPRMFSGEPSSALVERWTWNQPLIFSYADPDVLYTSSQHLWKTTDEVRAGRRSAAT